jgi:hypothetical protein
MMVLSQGVTMLAAARAGSDSGITEVGAATLYDIGAAIFVPGAAMGLGAMIGAFSVVALRTAVAPRWLAWVGVILTIGSVTPLAFIFVGIDALWVFGVSFLIFKRGTAPGGGGVAV